MFRLGDNGDIFSALAPMQDVTNRMFIDILEIFREPDLYVTEFLRVHETSIIDAKILNVIENRTSNKPISVQILGRDVDSILRIAKMLQKYNICAIDMNFGCPMPKIHKKGVGGGLLDEPEMISHILRALKENIDLPITVKSRIGFENSDHFEELLENFAHVEIDCLFLHARTVKGLYREKVDYSKVAFAKKFLACPVVANGDILTAEEAIAVSKSTNCDGVMIGRSAIRNPWIFLQITKLMSGENVFRPTLKDVMFFINLLIEKSNKGHNNDIRHVAYMKKFLNFIGQCVDQDGKFLREIRLTNSMRRFLSVCEKHLLGDNADKVYRAYPFDGVVARPNCE